MFDCIVEHAARAGVHRIVGVYRPTAKNVIVADLYTRLGFQVLAERGTDTLYEFVVPEAYERRCSFIEQVVAV